MTHISPGTVCLKHQVRFWLTPLRELAALPMLSSWIKGPTSKGMKDGKKGQGRERGRESRGRRKGKGGEGKGRKEKGSKEEGEGKRVASWLLGDGGPWKCNVNHIHA